MPVVNEMTDEALTEKTCRAGDKDVHDAVTVHLRARITGLSVLNAALARGSLPPYCGLREL